MKRRIAGIVFGTCFMCAAVAFGQTTATRGTPTITGFAPNPVSGYTANPVTGFTPAPVRGLGTLPRFPATTNFTTGPISPLSTRIATPGTSPIVIAPVVPQVVLPPVPVVPVTPNAGNFRSNPATTNTMTPLF